MCCFRLAQVPNPLFDLAGITCGHCLVPFWTFFGATLIGKAVIKMHLQVIIVLLNTVTTCIVCNGMVPFLIHDWVSNCTCVVCRQLLCSAIVLGKNYVHCCLLLFYIIYLLLFLLLTKFLFIFSRKHSLS